MLKGVGLRRSGILRVWRFAGFTSETFYEFRQSSNINLLCISQPEINNSGILLDGFEQNSCGSIGGFGPLFPLAYERF